MLTKHINGFIEYCKVSVSPASQYNPYQQDSMNSLAF